MAHQESFFATEDWTRNPELGSQQIPHCLVDPASSVFARRLQLRLGGGGGGCHHDSLTAIMSLLLVIIASFLAGYLSSVLIAHLAHTIRWCLQLGVFACDMLAPAPAEQRPIQRSAERRAPPAQQTPCPDSWTFWCNVDSLHAQLLST